MSSREAREMVDQIEAVVDDLVDTWEWQLLADDQRPSLVDAVTGRLIAQPTRHTTDVEKATMEVAPLLVAALQIAWTIDSEGRKRTEDEAAITIAAVAAVKLINELRSGE